MKKLIALLVITAFVFCSGCCHYITVTVGIPLYQDPIEIKGVQGADSQYALRIIVVDF